MKSPRMKIYATYSASYELLLNDFFLPSLKNTDLEIVTRKIDSVGSGIFGSESWSQTMLKKVNFTIEAVQENFGHIFIVSDVDVQFFKNISQNLIMHLEDKDIVFQSDDYFGRINAGFFACRGNDVMLGFWKEVKNRLEKSIASGEIHIFAEQHFIREILAKQPRNIRYGILPVDEYCSPRMEYIPNKKIFLSETLRMYHTTWTSGIENKKYHGEQVRSLVQRNFLLKMSHFYVGYYVTVLVHINFFVVREGAIFWEKYQNLYKRILSTFSSNIFIFMNKGLQVVQQIYFCILYSIKKRDYSCYPFIGDIIWHRHHDINLPEKPVIFHSSKNGFFSILIEAIGYLDYCEKRGHSPKIVLDTGYYLDVGKGSNWWEYYFERVLMKGNKRYANEGEQRGILPEYENAFGDYSRSYLSLNRKNELFRKYIKIHDTLLEEIDIFVREEFRDFYIIGCHIRGTDKRTKIRRKYSIETVIEGINRIAQDKNNYKIFLATDDQEYYLKMKAIYKDKIISRDCSRFHGDILKDINYRGYDIGKEVLTDGLILSKCHYFIGGSSNVSHAVLVINPNIQHKIIKFNC